MLCLETAIDSQEGTLEEVTGSKTGYKYAGVKRN
jgi:hypothetical protein